MYAKTALLAATLTLSVAGCGSTSADAPVTSPTAVASEDVASSPTSAPSMESGTSGEAATSSSGQTTSGPGSYITLADYDGDRGAFAATDVVLFFNADWCSTCKVARDNIQADLASIPAGLTIVIVDFDTATELREKYGVTVQHTFVQVDADGNELAKWSGSVTADEIAQNTV